MRAFTKRALGRHCASRKRSPRGSHRPSAQLRIRNMHRVPEPEVRYGCELVMHYRGASGASSSRECTKDLEELSNWIATRRALASLAWRLCRCISNQLPLEQPSTPLLPLSATAHGATFQLRVIHLPYAIRAINASLYPVHFAKHGGDIGLWAKRQGVATMLLFTETLKTLSGPFLRPSRIRLSCSVSPTVLLLLRHQVTDHCTA